MDKELKKKILEELGGIPEEFYDELVREFLGQVQNQIESIKQALSNDDFDTASKTAHSIKGSSGNLRLYEMQKNAQFIELESKSNPPNKEAIVKTVDLLTAALAEVRKDYP